MSRAVCLYILTIAACGVVAALVLASVLVTPARGQNALAVCGSGLGHGVGLSQWGAHGRAEAGQRHAAIVRAYYRGATLKEYPDDPGVRVLLRERSLYGSHTVSVPSGGEARLTSGTTAVRLGPGAYTVSHSGDAYRVRNVRTGKAYGPYRSPVVFRPVSGILRYGGEGYRGSLAVQVSSSRLLLVNRLPLEGYVRGVVVANEMPASWPAEALKAQAVAVRSYVRASRKSGPYDLKSSDMVYGGADSETAATDAAALATARVAAVYDSRPVKAFFSAANGGYVEDAAYVFGAAPYLKAFRDEDSSGRAYEARIRSPWTRWTGVLKSDGSPELGIGNITGVRVLERSPSGRATRVEVTGTGGKRTISGEYGVRYGLAHTGLRRADGSSYPAGDLPSARVSFGSACG